MAVSNGQDVSAEVTNAAFVSKTVDSTVQSKINLANGDAPSGAAVNNIQRAHNETFDTVGMTGVGDAGRKVYNSNNILIDGENHKQGLEGIDEAFHGSTGHGHSGIDGDGPPISAYSLTDFNAYFCEFGAFSKAGVSGLSVDVSGELTGKFAGGGITTQGVLTTAPDNRVEIIKSTDFTNIEDAEGQKVYGRLTGSVSTFTLEFFTNEAGVETAHSLVVEDIMVLYREIFNAANRPTIPQNPLEFGTLDITADVKDASATQRGVVTTGGQTFAGDKIHEGKQTFQSRFAFLESTDAATTGASALLPNPSTAIVRLTNVALTSIATIGLNSASQIFILINNTGNDIDLLDLSGAPAGQQISTGNGDFTLMDGASCMVVRGDTAQKFYIVGGGGGSSSPLTTKGDLWGFDGTVDVRVPVGADGTFLVADSTNPNGVTYRVLVAGDLPTVPINKGGTGQTTQTAGFDALSPTTSKGDIIVDDGTNAVRLPVGTDGQVPTADSLSATGISYKNIQGVKNYISNPGAESSATGANVYSDAVSAFPTDGSGGSPTVTVARSTSSPLRGLASYLISKTAVNSQGEGFSWDFSIDSADQAKPLQVSFDYEIASGTYSGGSGTYLNDSDLVAWIYDVTNAVLIPVSAGKLDGSVSGVKYQFRGEFQTSFNSTSYRLIIHVQSVSALAYALRVDEISVSPNIKSVGALLLDRTFFIPELTSSGGGAVTLNATAKVQAGWYWKEGHNICVEIILRNGVSAGASGAAGALKVGVPTFVVADLTKMSSDTVLGSYTGTCSKTYPTYKDTSGVYFVFGDNNVTPIEPGTTGVTQISDLVAGAVYNMSFKFPVLGWGVSQTLSSDNGGRDVAMRVNSSTTTINGSPTQIVWNTVNKDSHGKYNASTGAYTIPEDGWYDSEAAIYAGTNAGSSAQAAQIGLVKNGTPFKEKVYRYPYGGTYVTSYDIKDTNYFLAGDIIHVYFLAEGSSQSIVSTGTGNTFSIKKNASRAQIASSEKVVSKAGQSSGQSIPSASETVVVYNNILKTSHGTYNASTGKFTCAKPGDCDVRTFMMFDFATWGATSFGQAKVFKNGVGISVIAVYTADATQCRASLSGSTVVPDCRAGDEIDIRIYQDSGSSKTLVASTDYVHATFKMSGE